MSIDQTYNFKKIDKTMSLSGLPTVEALSILKSEGYEVVLNLLPHNHKRAIPKEKEIVESQGLVYKDIPVDFSQPTVDDYNEFADSIKKFEGQKSIVHCVANYRASAFYAIYAFKELGWSKDRAMELVHSIWSPSKYPVWDSFISKQLNTDR